MQEKPTRLPARPGSKVLRGLGFEPGPHQFPAALASLRKEALESAEPGHQPRCAFEALVQYASTAYAESKRAHERDPARPLDPTPTQRVRVEWWIVKTLAGFWREYTRDKTGRNLDSVMGLSGGKGRKPLKDTQGNVRRDRGLALEIANETERGLPVHGAKTRIVAANYISSDNYISPDIVDHAWKMHGAWARRVVRTIKQKRENLAEVSPRKTP